VFSYTPLHI